MGIMGILFNPNGRIQANQFWQGVIVLVGFQILLSLIDVFGMSLGTIGTILSFAIIYPYLCVYGKRLHDSNNTAWLFLLFAIGHFIISIIFLFFTPGLGEFISEYMQLAQAGDQEAMEALAEQFQENAVAADGLIISFTGLFLSNLLLGFLVARMFSDPHTNKYGPPVGGEAEGTSDDNDIFS